VAFNKGETVAPGLLLDGAGEPTQDPGVMFPAGTAPTGALLPMGGHKGYALAMVCEMLGAALIGGHTGRDAHLTLQHAIINNMLALVFDPARMDGAPMFGAEVAAFVEWVRSSPRRPGVDAILMPGEPEQASRTARAGGIPVDGGTLAALDDAAARVSRASGVTVAAPSSLA